MHHQEQHADHRVFLFLQGPHGPFFNALGRMLRASGAQTWRVGFNAGDQAFWFDRKSYIPYRDAPEHWPEVMQALIAEKGISLWLRADLDLLWSRVRHKTTRPLLMTDNPYQTLKAIFEERDPIYAQAQIAVDAHTSYSIETMTDHVIAALLERPDILEA